VSIFPPRALLGRLARRLELLTDGAHDQPERLRSLRAGIAWSYDLLSADEQRLFRRLAVFAGGCTLAAAEAIDPDGAPATLDLVAALVDRSLLQPVTADGGEPRLAMLETIGEGALGRVGGGGGRAGGPVCPAEPTRPGSAPWPSTPSPACAGPTSSTGGMSSRPTWTTFGRR